MSTSQKAIRSFDLLRQCFVRTTVPANIMALQRDLNERIVAYNNKETTADPAKQVKELPLLDAHKLNPIFADFCTDGEKFFEKDQDEAKALQYQRAIEEYILMKEKVRAEVQIMEANRVGVDKNLANIIKNTAGHVGLQMPKEYDHDQEPPKK